MGILYVCSTPIGNLEDITLRALRVLKEVDFIAAEDTRQTIKLLNIQNVQAWHCHASPIQNRPKLISYHKFNIKQRTKEIIQLLHEDKNIALVSDAGTPGISDPGEELIKTAIENHIKIVPIPGPSAAICALSVSGLKTESFVFEGFLPREGKMRRRILRGLVDEKRTIIFYESPHRLLKSLKDIDGIFKDRKICIAREMTKIYEEFFTGTASEAIEKFKGRDVLGEITIVMQGTDAELN